MVVRLGKCWLCLVFLWAFFPSASHAAAISGTIKLPVGDVASSTMYISIGATDITGGQSNQFTNVTIAAGTSSTIFTLDDIPADPSAKWRIRYSCFDNYEGCLDYVLVGYYDSSSSGDVSYKEGDATTVLQGTSGVVFEMLDGIKLGGSLTSPLGNAPVGGIDVRMSFAATGVSASVDYAIPEGEDSVDFTVTMPKDVALNYKVYYSCDTTPSASDYCTDFFLSRGYYQSSVPNNTVNSSDAAQTLAGNASNSSIDMTLLSGSRISGVISRIGSAGTANDVALFISATDRSDDEPTANAHIVIPAGSSSVDYNLVVSSSASSDWAIKASCETYLTSAGCADYGENTYYDTDTVGSNSTAESVDADLLAGNTDHSNINFTLVSAKVISGVLMLPSPLVAPAGGIDMFITAQEYTGAVAGPNTANTAVTIPAGNTSVAYSIDIPNISGAAWRLNLNCDTVTTPDGCKLLTPSVVFYDLNGSSNTTISPEDADTVSGVGDITGINMTLISAVLASGQVTLGSGRVAPEGGLIVRFRGRGYLAGEEEVNNFDLLTIPEGANSAAYSFALTELDGILWTIEIECDTTNPGSACTGYKPKTYYANTVPETTSSTDPFEATYINPFAPIGEINITLLSNSVDELCVPIKTSGGQIALVCL